jgi:recombinational DNA repair protein (RecF pathway)
VTHRAGKRCPRCGRTRPAAEFYRRQGSRLSSYCRSCLRAAARAARRRRRQDPAAVDQLRAVDRVRQRRHRALGGQDPSGGDAA